MRRKQFGKRRLAWRSHKRSLGWILYLQSERCQTHRRCHPLRRPPLSSVAVAPPWKAASRQGVSPQDTRGRWYVNLQCKVADQPRSSLGLDGIGIDLGLKDQIACSDGILYSRANLTAPPTKTSWPWHSAPAKRTASRPFTPKSRTFRKDWTHKVTTAIVQPRQFHRRRRCVQYEADQNPHGQIDLRCGLGHDQTSVGIQSH